MNDFNKALSKAMKYCSKKEVCVFDVLMKLKSWNIEKQYYKQIISNLKKENFINEKRYASAFARDKFKFNKWGKNKIFYTLSKKQIPETYINEALNSIPEKAYFFTAEKLILAKIKNLKESDDLLLKKKLISFMANKGYEIEIIKTILDKLI